MGLDKRPGSALPAGEALKGAISDKERNVIEERMCYVAADPNQPGAAWAACVIDPRWAEDTAKSVSEWIKDGANTMQVPVETAREMLGKWVRPGQKELF